MELNQLNGPASAPTGAQGGEQVDWRARFRRPTLQQKVSAAVFVLAMPQDMPGIGTTMKLMWPWVDYTDDDVRRQAAKVLASACTAMLATLPQAQLQQIWKDQDEYLSFALEGEPPDGASPSGAAGSPPPA